MAKNWTNWNDSNRYNHERDEDRRSGQGQRGQDERNFSGDHRNFDNDMDLRSAEYSRGSYRELDRGSNRGFDRNPERDLNREMNREMNRDFSRDMGREMGRRDRDGQHDWSRENRAMGREFRGHGREETFGGRDRDFGSGGYGLSEGLPGFNDSRQSNRSSGYDSDWGTTRRDDMRDQAGSFGGGIGSSMGRGNDMSRPYTSDYGYTGGMNRDTQVSASNNFNGSSFSNSSTYDANAARNSYAGRGPKGWRRSDDRIREDVNETLEMHPHIDASEIEIEVKEGMVVLRGHVEDRRQKRLAEDVIENLPGVRDVRNEISVNQSLFERAKEAILGGPEKSGATTEKSTVRAPSKH